MRVAADSHAIIWYVQGSSRLSDDAADALAAAEASDGIVVSVATLVDLWYVTQTTQGVSADDLAMLRSTLVSSPKVDLHPIDIAIADETTSIPRDLLAQRSLGPVHRGDRTRPGAATRDARRAHPLSGAGRDPLVAATTGGRPVVRHLERRQPDAKGDHEPASSPP